MKRTYIIGILCFLFQSLSAQDYIPFPDSGATWVNYYHDYSFEPFPDEWFYFCNDGSDTVINTICLYAD